LSVFSKYDQYGAYHWRDVGRRIKCHNPYTAERYRLVTRALDGLPECGRLLDYGCGDGALLGLISKVLSKWEFHGYDPSTKGVELARMKLAERNLRAEIESDSTRFRSESFDVVTCCEVLEHVEEPVALLSELRRICHPHGQVILTTPIRLTEKPLDPEHIREYFPQELIDLCRNSGLFQVRQSIRAIPAGALEVYKYGFLPFLPKGLVSFWMKMASAWLGLDSLTLSCRKNDLFCVQLLRLSPLSGPADRAAIQLKSEGY
jgi:2-polyprenyl-3-methyl-5-hydroxy-6-metoxy-1,4-benzoquinol methylase